MKRTSRYTKAPKDIAGEIEVSRPIKDFLPSPREIASLIRKEETIPVTMKLKKKTVHEYKTYARKMGIKYQTFLSALLDKYARHLHG
jgi:predicted DNA binding CopG/RHH family protein